MGHFLFIFGCRYIFMFLYFLRTIQLLHTLIWYFVHIFPPLLWHSMYQKKFHSTYSSAWGIMSYFWACFWYIPQSLEELKIFSWYFAWMFWCYFDGLYTRKCFGSPSASDILVFLVHVVLYEAFSSEFLFNFLFRNIK